ncbi:MAG: radical SAM protein [Promethearchaeati archaeon SRVP18_Atabeyarchaeia-1]
MGLFNSKNGDTMSLAEDGGKSIVLTASEVEMSDFNLNLVAAFAGSFPLGFVPRRLIRRALYPANPYNEDGTAKLAPYGLRKVEAILVKEFGKENVATVHPRNLARFVGPRTKVVGISAMDSLGHAFVSRTYTSILGLGGKPLNRIEFEKILSDPAIMKYKPRVILGGAGAWQVPELHMQDALGIDTVVIGQAERTVAKIFREAVNGEKLPKVITSDPSRLEDVPIIENPALYGASEITRGCGRNCAFCSPTMRRLVSFPLEHILKEVRLNARRGTRAIFLQTDDVFLYRKKDNFHPNREALVKLVESVARIEGVEFIQFPHASFAPVCCDPRLIEEIAPTIVEKSLWHWNGKHMASFEMGFETGSVRLMRKYMAGKMLPFKPEQWHDVVTEAVGILDDNDICPLATLVIGLPGEQEEDTNATLELIGKLKNNRVMWAPIFFTSEEESLLRKRKHMSLRSLTDLQWEVLSTCWRSNFDTWKKQLNPIISLLSFLAFPYYRLKHGRGVFRPMMKFAGLDLLMRRGQESRRAPRYDVPCYSRKELTVEA